MFKVNGFKKHHPNGFENIFNELFDLNVVNIWNMSMVSL